MKGICSIIFVISTFISFAEDKGSKVIIWLDGSDSYMSNIAIDDATLYFSAWEYSIVDHLDARKGNIALQLDHTLDPNPTDGDRLPNLKYLSAVADKNVLNEYLEFLEDYSRTMGYSHLVLPDTAGFSSLEKKVISIANKKAPYFFISNAYVSLKLPSSKKEISTNHPIIWVSNQSGKQRKISKWNRKATQDYFKPFYDSVTTVSEKAFTKTNKIPFELARKVFEQSVIAHDPNHLLPIKRQPIAYIGKDRKLKRLLEKYANNSKDNKQLVIVDRRGGPIQKVPRNAIIIDHIGAEVEDNSTTILTHERMKGDEITIAKMLFGVSGIYGQSDQISAKVLEPMGLLGYSNARYEGLDEEHITWVDDLAADGIKNYATPGCQLSVVKNGSIVFEKSYGHFTYDSLKFVDQHTLYDLASITKVVATLPAIALLLDQGKITLEDSIGKHLNGFAASNKSHVTIKELLAHNGGIRSYIPFWRWAMDGDRLEAFYYKTKEDEKNDIRTYGMPLHPNMRDSLTSWITKSDLLRKKYNYSDLGFMILHLLVESVSGQTFDSFLEENFYKPMGLNIVFNPKSKGLSFEAIAPTEYDDRYRNDQVWGEVHDRNAYVFGGVAGHAGLFSNATDLAKMMYMLTNGGFYNGKQYLKKETLDQFNLRHFKNNRRGLGWDKKDWIKDSASSQASDSSFGHTGFTGTMVWSDPENELIYVFLSNRIYPDSNNDKLMELNIRTGIHDVIYESIIDE